MNRPEPLRLWLEQRRPSTARFPFTTVVNAYQYHGKTFVPEEWTRLLTDARERLPEVRGARRTHLSAFLDTALDKVDRRYDYRTYLALNLLPIIGADEPPADELRLLARRDRLYVHLLTDLMAFELQAASDAPVPLPKLRPGAPLVAKRLRHALRAAMPALRRLRLTAAVDSGEDSTIARQVVVAVDRDLSASDRWSMQVSMLPVWIIHDEWMFIRVLQAFEASFALLAADLRAAIANVQNGRVQLAATRLSAAAALLRECAPLWSLMATLQPEAFHQFRRYTEGASAIQSRSYKMLESLCRLPDPDRLNSPAYLSVPEVRSRIDRGHLSLDDALDALTASGRYAAESPVMAAAMRNFAAALRQWRQTHYRLAVRMLGPDQPGTGYTQGTSYLAAARQQPVFQRCLREDNPTGDHT
ncbi:tryptophan 2,3-dioxygenase family protein [Micromonospora profundi]|uniref:tryptophan 2,3-dioxygenase family protein n=1 Tax=Micromonospora profundi TaxID=1420889 RepID=UPI0036673408